MSMSEGEAFDDGKLCKMRDLDACREVLDRSLGLYGSDGIRVWCVRLCRGMTETRRVGDGVAGAKRSSERSGT
jgi:hypothetical protein